jgi:hypothetical protein
MMDWIRRRTRGSAENRLRLRSRTFRFFGGVASAVSYADLGPYAGAPRKPKLKNLDETVSQAVHQVAQITVATEAVRCSQCGQGTVETHETPAGPVRACRTCQADSWLLRSRMPSAVRARAAARKYTV